MSREPKRSVTVELLGQRFQVRTGEPETEVILDAQVVEAVLEEIRRRSGPLDSLRLYALGLLHLGRELRMRDAMYRRLYHEVKMRVEAWSQELRSS